VVGIVDDSAMRVGRFIRGVEALGTLGDLAQVVDKLKQRSNPPQRLIVAKTSIAGETLGALMDTADQLGLTVARLPRRTDCRTADAGGVSVQPIAIEDLLGRPQAVLNRAAMKALIDGKRVLVTGAGGTIGAELARQISDLAPAHLSLIDN